MVASLGDAEALADRLRGLYEACGVPLPDEAVLRGDVLYTRLPDAAMASAVTMLLQAGDGRHGLFRLGEDLVRWDEEEGRMVPMGAMEFRTWLPQRRGVMLVEGWRKEEVRGVEKRVPVAGSLTKDKAAMLLACGELRAKVPRVLGVNATRLPVLREELDERGLRRLELLPVGYDERTRIFTMPGALEFDRDWDWRDGVEHLYSIFRTFGWREESRDLSIQLAALMTLFCRGVYEGKSPAFAWNANVQESGKSVLATFGPWAVFGSRQRMPLLQDQEQRLQETLNSQAMGGAAYTLFDNVDWGAVPIKSALLDQWIDGEEWAFRRLYTNSVMAPKIRGVTLLTGNKMKLSPDLQRRTLLADLWNPLSGADRALPPGTVVLDALFFGDEGNRRRALAAMWSILRGWDEAGRPTKPGRRLGSFEAWSDVVPGLVWWAGQQFGRAWDCLARGTNEEVGDVEALEVKRVAAAAIQEFGAEGEGVMRARFDVTVAQLAGVARRMGLFTRALYPELDVESVLSTEGSKGGWRFEMPKVDGDAPWEVPIDEEALRWRQASEYLTPKSRSAFGSACKNRLHEKWFLGHDGELYEFRHVHGMRASTYQVSRVQR